MKMCIKSTGWTIWLIFQQFFQIGMKRRAQKVKRILPVFKKDDQTDAIQALNRIKH